MRARFIIVGKSKESALAFGDGETRVTLIDGSNNEWYFRISNNLRWKHHVKGGWFYKFTGHYRENRLMVVDSILHIVEKEEE